MVDYSALVKDVQVNYKAVDEIKDIVFTSLYYEYLDNQIIIEAGKLNDDAMLLYKARQAKIAEFFMKHDLKIKWFGNKLEEFEQYNGDVVMVSEIPECNFCDNTAEFTGKTSFGRQVYLCQDCLNEFMTNMGIEKAHKLILSKQIKEVITKYERSNTEVG